MRIVNARGGYYVERKSRFGMALGAVLLGIAWFVLAIPLFIGGSGGTALVLTVVLGIPAIVLAAKAARKRWKITAVIEARQVAGGVLVHVMDVRQVAHQLVTDEQTAQGLAHVLTGRTGIGR
jgi:hypothetical protein